MASNRNARLAIAFLVMACALAGFLLWWRTPPKSPLSAKPDQAASKKEIVTDKTSLTQPEAKVEESAAPAPQTPAPRAANTEQAWDQAVDVLKLINVHKNSVTGSWRMEKGELSSERSDAATLEIPYVPPSEYDFRIEFTVPSEGGSVGQILYANGRQFGWYMGAYTNAYAGFQMIDGKAMPENPTGVKTAPCLKKDHTHTSLVEVRRHGVKAYLDGKLITQWKTDYRNMSLFQASRLRAADVLGLWSADMATTFRRAQVREISGAGSVIRSETVPAEF